MSKFANLIAVSLLGAAASVHAADRPFVGLAWGETRANFNTSAAASANTGIDADRVIRGTDTWGVRAGVHGDSQRYYAAYNYVSGSHGGANFRLQTATASYDQLLPLGDTTRLFGGASAGVNYLSQIPGQFNSDRDWGVHGGLQAGLLQDIGDNLQFELGYRYTRNYHTEVDLVRGQSGDARLNSTRQPYLALNYRF